MHLSGRNVDEAVLRTCREGASAWPATPRRASSARRIPPSLETLGRLLQDPVTLAFLARRARRLAAGLGSL